jgi:hypothetical protein
MRTRTRVCVLAAFLLVQMAWAQDSCKSYVGQRISPVSIETLIAAVSKIHSMKDEFESTSEFEAKQAETQKGMPQSYIVAGPSPDPKFLDYDADAQELKIKTYALKNMGVFYDVAFGYGTPFFQKVKFSTTYNKAVGISNVSSKVGSYSASNAFGAATRVNVVDQKVKAIFDREAAFGEKFFLDEGPDAVVGKMAIGPAEAKQLKSTMRVAYVASPKPPYLATGTKQWSPTIESPNDITMHLTVVIAQIRCGLLTDAGNTVLAAYETH